LYNIFELSNYPFLLYLPLPLRGRGRKREGWGKRLKMNY